MRSVASLAAGLVLLASAPAAAGWTPRTWTSESTLELRTTAPGEGAHWFPVWLVVLDEQVFVRLGSRAADRLAQNQTAPFVGVRIGGQEFGHVRPVPVPEATGRVAAAMREKYWFDVVARRFDHPLTLRLQPE